MTDHKIDDIQQDEVIKSEVSSGFKEAKEFAKTLSIDEIKSGQWFVALLQRVVRSYDRNAKAEYFQQKYPGLPADEIADILTTVTVKYAAIAGGMAGVAATTNQIATLGTSGMTIPLIVTVIGAEMIYLARIQMRLVLDLTVIYDLHLDPDDPEDILMIFGYALGVAPTEMIGKGLQIATRTGAKSAIKKYISKGTLKTIQDFAQKIGFKILQRTIIKYTIPIVSAVAGSSYNYVVTKSLGKIAKTHLKNRGKVTDELRSLVSRQHTYDLAFPAAAMYMMQVDGQISAKENELYRALLSRMSFEEHTPAEFQKMIDKEENILEAIAKIGDEDVHKSLVDVLALMAVYDGKLAEEEREFLVNAAEYLNVPLDIDKVEKQADEYRVTVEKTIFHKMAKSAKKVTSKSIGINERAVGSAKGIAAVTKNKVTGTFSKMRRKKKGADVQICMSCHSNVPVEYQFCPSCGQSMSTEKNCVSCNEVLSIDFAFCPHCGVSQEKEN